MNKYLNLKSLFVALFLLVGFFFISQAFFSDAAVANLSTPKRGDNLELQRIDTGRVGAWVSAGIFPTPREKYSMVYYSGYAYILGGTVGWGFDGDITSTVLYAPVDLNGNFGEWKYTASIPGNANFDNAAFTANGFVYVVGGYTEKLKPTASVWYSRIQPDYSLGEWKSASPLQYPTAEADLVYRNGFVYLVGGRTRNPANTQLNQVFYAKVNNDGTLGDWLETYPLSVGVSLHEVVAHGNHIYVLGGEDDPGYSVRTVYYTGFNEDGSLNHWIETTPLPNKLEGFYAEFSGDYVYVLGGSGFGIRGYKDVWFNKVVLNDGALGKWINTTPLPLEVSLIDGFIANQRINIIGGKLNFNGPGDVTDKTWTAPIDVAVVNRIFVNILPQ